MKIILSAKTKDEIIDAFAKALHFPAYYSHNWDSFEELVSDMIEGGQFPKSLEITLGEINQEMVTCLKILADQGLVGSGELTFISDSTGEANAVH